MSWASAIKERPPTKTAPRLFTPVTFETEQIDWDRLVTLDFETYYDADYTLSKLSTSEYIRDPRFKAQMVGIKIGNKATKVFPAGRVKTELRKITWQTHSLLCHHTQFDAFVLSHHYGIQPEKLYCTMSMARGLYSNEIGAGLDEVSKFCGGHGKIEGGLEPTKGVRNWSPALVKSTGIYCANDVDECLRIFKHMLPQMPRDEVDLIDLTVRMFTDPVLKVNLPRVEAELAREIAARDELMMAVRKLIKVEPKLTGEDKLLTGRERDLAVVRKVVGSNEQFADLLRAQGIDPPVKVSASWMKKPSHERKVENKYVYAFAKDDAEFNRLDLEFDDHVNLEDPGAVMMGAVRQAVLRALIDVRLAVKSTTNITRAQRFLTAGADGMPLPAYYAYARAHTLRWGGGDKRNMQNLQRGGELRKSIDAPPGYQLAVADSGQIEARVNGWLWGQDDLLDAFRAADEGTGRDAYCLMGDVIYGRTITKADTMERFVGKVAVLGLGFQMGAPKLQMTLAKGALGGPPVYFSLSQCEAIVNKYRRKNHRIQWGWEKCKQIIEDMAAGRTGSFKCLSWGDGFILLPNGMTLKYPDLKKAVGDKGWEEWSYQSGNVRKKIYGGLLCVGAKTEVLTTTGWKPIIEVRFDDLVWDGQNWVAHGGLEYRGSKQTLDFGGVRMTPDHKVLVDEQWPEAQHTTHAKATSSFARHYRAPTWDDGSDRAHRFRRATNSLVDRLRLRTSANADRIGIRQGQHELVRVLNSAVHLKVPHDAWNESPSGVCRVAEHDRPLQTANSPSMGKLRRARDRGMRALEEVRKFLGRHASGIPGRPDVRARGERPGLQQGELHLGDTRRASQQPTQQPEEPVYDLIDAGPKNRFTVRGADERPFIVHNCENIVQCLARLVVGWQMLNISRKHRVVLTTHDEVVACIKKASAPAAFQYMLKCMRTAPAWCADIPLNAEGGFADNYSK